VFVPCELIERNGDNLQHMVLRHVEAWGLGREFAEWVRSENYFLNTLVDRIVSGYPREEAAALTESLGYQDALLDAGEVFHLWVIEGPPALAEEFPFHKAGLNVVWTDDLTPYRTRKVRILNGAHTAGVLAAFQAGLDTVREMVDDPLFGRFLQQAVFAEILPGVPLAEEAKTAYAEAVLERFRNPFVRHELLSIALNSVSKWKVRVLPSLLDYLRQRQHLPPVLTFSLAALIHFYRGTAAGGTELRGRRGETEYAIRDAQPVLKCFENAWAAHRADGSTHELVMSLLAEQELWATDLSVVPGLVAAVSGGVSAILEHGAHGAVQALLSGALS
jgi:tagaturonate reductase